MKIPKHIHGKNKIRDAMIIKLLAEGKTGEEIIQERNLKLSPRRIDQIRYNNRQYFKIDRAYEEEMQLLRIKQHIRKSPSSRKDVYDWETLLDSKISAKKVEHSGIPSADTKVVVVIQEKNGNQSDQGRIPRGVSILREEVPSL